MLKRAGEETMATYAQTVGEGFYGGAERDRTADLLVAKTLIDAFSTT